MTVTERTPRAREGTGWYVYGAVPAETSRDAFDDVRGVNAAGAISLVAEGSVAAVVSQVPMEEFGEGAIDENLRAPAWLEEKVRGHEAVLEAALRTSAVVPFRFGAIYRGEEQVREMLRRHQDLAPALERLRGTVELGVKGFFDPAGFRAARAGEEAPASGGRAYLLQKQRERKLDEESRELRAARARESHELLATAALDARLLAPYAPEVTAHAGEMFLNAAYLVESAGERRFREGLAQLDEQHRADGVSYELTGPWPPYNFVEAEA